MKVFELPNNTKTGYAYTHKVVVDHTDLTESTDNTTQTIDILSPVPGTVVQSAALKVVTEFEDASDSAFDSTTLILGDNGTTSDDDRYITSTQVNANGTVVSHKANANTAPYAFYESAKKVQLKVGSMADKKLSDIDSGEVHIYLRVANVNEI